MRPLVKKALIGFILGCALGIALTIACVRCTTWLDGIVRKVQVTEYMIGE